MPTVSIRLPVQYQHKVRAWCIRHSMSMSALIDHVLASWGDSPPLAEIRQFAESHKGAIKVITAPKEPALHAKAKGWGTDADISLSWIYAYALASCTA